MRAVPLARGGLRRLVVASFLWTVLTAQESAAQVKPRTLDRDALGALDQAEVRQGTAGEVPIFRGRGEDRTVEGGEATLSPQPLEADALRAVARTLGAPEPGSLYARVTPSNPGAPGRAALVFVKPAVVEGGQGFALFENRRIVTDEYEMSMDDTHVEGYAVLWLWSPADRRYLIDCAVGGAYWTKVRPGEPLVFAPGIPPSDPRPLFKPLHFRVAGPGPDQRFDFDSYDEEGYHLVFSLEAEEAGWFPFYVSTLPPGELRNTEWRLHSCQSTNL